MKRRACILVSLLLLVGCQLSAQTGGVIRLDGPWRFHPGDSMAYARPSFDDHLWKTLRVDKMWEEQGYPSLDGYAWYRTTVTIPSRLLKSASLKDSLGFFLGRIDDLDQAYLNGRQIGRNGSTIPAGASDTSFGAARPDSWQMDRRYVLGVRDPRIRWDSVNVIAVRVLDVGGMGGMWSGGQAIRLERRTDYLSIDRTASVRFGEETMTKPITVRNSSAHYALSGVLDFVARGKLDGRMLKQEQKRLDLGPESALTFPVNIPVQDQSALVQYTCILVPGPDTVTVAEELPYIVTPPTGRKPRINSPSRYGARPGHPFLYAIPVSGAQPIVFKAQGLPDGFELDPVSGIISGTSPDEGTYRVILFAKNPYGETTRKLTIVFGPSIALTPPLGWNSWNAFGWTVDQQKILASARALKEHGLAGHGWSYMNIDDGWEMKGDDTHRGRDAAGAIIPNRKFPDMKALGDSVHAMGLKLGIYSSPGPLTCGGYTGSYGFEDQDARSYAFWGVDYLKYDWCTYSKIAKDTSRQELAKPFRAMRGALDGVNRDIVYSICQYGMGRVWEWGASAGANCWRTTGDISDNWKSVRDIGFNQIAGAAYAGPGHWNDPDMLVVGWVGWGSSQHPSNLTPDEQYTHVTLWCLLSAPLLLGCDLTRLDAFTLNLLTNDEVLAVDQDALGKQAVPVVRSDSVQVWLKDLEDSSRAVGVFNLSSKTAAYRLDLRTLGFASDVIVRDLWRQRAMGNHRGAIQLTIPSHGVVLLKLR